MKNPFNNYRNAALFMVIGLTQFIIISFIAMLSYQGGNPYNPQKLGYNFILNFFSDLGLWRGFGAQSNVISPILFSISLIIVAVSYLPLSFWIPKFFPSGTISHVLSKISIPIAFSASIGYIGVGITPHNVVPLLHNITVILAFSSAFLLGLVYVLIVLLSPGFKKRYVIAFFIMSVAFTFYASLSGNEVFEVSLILYQLEVIAQKFAVYSQIFAFAWFGWSFHRFECKEEIKTIHILNFQLNQAVTCEIET